MATRNVIFNSKNVKCIILALILFTTIVTMSKKFTKISRQNKPDGSISVLTANVGNLSIGCRDVLYKLCYKDVEKRITENIDILRPDIVAIQEVLAPWQCNKAQTTNQNKVCFDSKQNIPQIRRLLGNDYTIVCTNRDRDGRGFECIAVRTEIGNILGCPTGSLCYSARTSKEINGCDNGFTVSAATIELKNGFKFDIVNFHPQSTDDRCRAKMISQSFDIFEGNKPLIEQPNVLLMGDFNFDPWRDEDKSTETWNAFLSKGWAEKKFLYHSGLAEKDPPYFTSSLFYRRRTVDFVVSNFAEGICNVLGESPNTTRLDGGEGTDHRAIFGFLILQNR